MRAKMKPFVLVNPLNKMSSNVKAREFPLYDELAQEARNSHQIVDPNILANTLNGLNEEHTTMIFALFYHHSLLNKGASNFSKLPYNPTRPSPNSRGLIYQLNNIPPFLQHVIYRYILRITTPTGTATSPKFV